MVLPYLSNTSGWLLTEVGRQPWIVFGLMKTQDAVSPGVSTGTVAASLAAFALVYATLIGVDVYLLNKFARRGLAEDKGEPTGEEAERSAFSAAGTEQG
jgi:cytochrome d ubiquinol oxidase subunit I